MQEFKKAKNDTSNPETPKNNILLEQLEALSDEALKDLVGNDFLDTRNLPNSIKEILETYSSGIQGEISDWLLSLFSERKRNLDLPEEFGPFKILDRLGAGGMGEIFLAQQLTPIKRLVALKILKNQTKETVERFKWEYLTLAQLEHEGIACIFDAGVDNLDHPWFSMAYLNGSDLSTYADQRQLDLKSRLFLFLQVCEAVEYAHCKGIVHRDLKPSNIIVVQRLNRPVAKIIDFGIAGIQSQNLTEKPYELGSPIIGTLAYMSPEQLNEPQRVDTRSDIYSLGVLLFELVTGRPPVNWIEAQDPVQALASLHQNPPLAGDVLKNSERSREGKHPVKAKKVRGDLENIIRKAMAPLPEDRYRTVAALREDVNQYLTHHPVSASPKRSIRNLGMLLERHRLITLLCLLLAMGLTTAGISMYLSLKREAATLKYAELQRNIALLESSRNQATTDFLNDLFLSVDPFEEGRASMDIQSFLERASRRLETDFEKRPLLKAQLKQDLGRYFVSIGRNKEAGDHFKGAHMLIEQTLGAQDPETLAALALTTWTMPEADAEPLLHNILGAWDAGGIPQDERLASIRARMGQVLNRLERPKQALPFLEQAQSYFQTQQKTTREAFSTELSYANALEELGRKKEAERAYRDFIAKVELVKGTNHPLALSAKKNLAGVLLDLGRLEEALALHEEVLRGRKLIFGENHVFIASTLMGLSLTYYQLGEYAYAETYTREATELFRANLNPGHPRLRGSANNLGMILNSQKKFEQAAEILQPLVVSYRESNSLYTPQGFRAANNLADALMGQNRLAEADQLTAEILAAAEQEFKQGHPLLMALNFTRGELLLRLNALQQATALFVRGSELCQTDASESDPLCIYYLGYAGYCLAQKGDPTGKTQLQKAVELLKGRKGIYEDHIKGFLETVEK